MATVDKYLKVRKGVDTPDVLTSSATIYDYLHTPVVYFDTASPALPAVGGLVWDDGEGTLSFGLKGGNLNLEIGQENIALCYNGTASAIAKGDVVYVSGAQGQRPSIAIATAATEQGSSKVFGIAAESIASGAEGFVATFGVVPEINTQGFTEGAALWLSASPGKFTQTKPLSPNHLVFVGYCLKANASSGRIFVNPQNGYELEELHDVLITSASNNHIISYNAASGLWINKNILDAIKEVDGASSGLDADLLDGQHGSYYAPIASATFTGYVNVPEPLNDSNAATKKYVDDTVGGQAIVVSSASAYPLSATEHSLFFNTSSERMAIRVGSVWKEFSFVSDAPVGGGDSSTLVFASSIDGGDSSTTNFVNNYDGGNS